MSSVSDVHQPMCPFVSVYNRWQTRWDVPNYAIYIYTHTYIHNVCIISIYIYIVVYILNYMFIFLAGSTETPSSWVGNSTSHFISRYRVGMMFLISRRVDGWTAMLSGHPQQSFRLVKSWTITIHHIKKASAQWCASLMSREAGLSSNGCDPCKYTTSLHQLYLTHLKS